jgi:hypothetical protein
MYPTLALSERMRGRALRFDRVARKRTQYL